MKNKIELTIEHKDHYTVELTNEKGDTFTYNPQKYEGLEDFMSRAKIIQPQMDCLEVRTGSKL